MSTLTASPKSISIDRFSFGEQAKKLNKQYINNYSPAKTKVNTEETNS